MVVMPNTMSDLEPLLGLFAHPVEPLDYMVIRWTSESKSSSLASNSSKSMTHSPIDEVAKRSRVDLVEFFVKERERERERERELDSSLWKIGKRNWWKKRKVKASQRSFSFLKVA